MFAQSARIDLELGETIVQKVLEISVFGSTNKKTVLEVNIKFLKLLKALTFILLGTHPAIEKKLRVLKETDAKLYEFYRELKQRTPVDTIPMDYRSTVFHAGDQIAWMTVKDLVNLKTYQLLTSCYPPKYFDWKENDLETMIACLAEYLAQLKANEDMKKPFSEEKLLRELMFFQSFSNGVEPKEPMARQMFLDKTLDDIKNVALRFGFANCSMMADIAFLEASSMKISHQITYLRFINTNTKLEELHVIAIGEWPKPGCLIISSWQDEENRYYYWNGSIEETAGVRRAGAYNQSQTLFTLRPGTEETEAFREKLTQADYSNWIASDARRNGIQSVRDFKEGLKEALSKTGYLSVVPAESTSSKKP